MQPREQKGASVLRTHSVCKTLNSVVWSFLQTQARHPPAHPERSLNPRTHIALLCSPLLSTTGTRARVPLLMHAVVLSRHVFADLKMMTKLLFLTLTVAVFGASPDGPNQQCEDDAGPRWIDDQETFGSKKYHDNTPATPHLNADGSCPSPLSGACAAKGSKAAFLEGPVDCGRQGWFCRIMPQEGWIAP